MIGGYESAWLTDLVADYILDNTQNICRYTLFSGIYRDDGIMVKEGIITKHGIAEWLHFLNEEVECLVGSNHLKFTVEILGAGGVDDGVKLDRVTVCNKEVFPYLDMEFF